MINGTAYDETLGDQLRVTVITTGLISCCSAQQSPLTVVQQAPQHATQQHLRTGTDSIPVLNQVAKSGLAGTASGLNTPGTLHTPQTTQPPQHSYEELNSPIAWRTNRTRGGEGGCAG